MGGSVSRSEVPVAATSLAGDSEQRQLEREAKRVCYDKPDSQTCEKTLIEYRLFLRKQLERQVERQAKPPKDPDSPPDVPMDNLSI